jgi:hypothetical protein
MISTTELRWIERETLDRYGKTITIKVLQQKWVDKAPRYSWFDSGVDQDVFEWRDVPTVIDSQSLHP